jgi:hypothetical protein
MAMNKAFRVWLCFLASLMALRAQRVHQQGNELVLEDSQGQRTSLGKGFNAVPISQHEFLIIRGAQMGYGEESSCERPDAMNRVVIYDTTTHKDLILFDKPISNPDLAHDGACVYEHADLSPSGSTLYLVSPCYATSGCLAVINLATGKAKYIPGAMDVFVIRGGNNAGDLIYMCRLNRKPTEADPRIADYAYIHARPDGSLITVISHEDLVPGGGNAPAPILRAYLRRIHGRIYAQGEWVP